MPPLSKILTSASPLSLAREAAWRFGKSWRKRRILVHMQEQSAALVFRNVPYFQPGTPRLSRENRDLLVGFADQICKGRFPLLGYGTLDLTRLPPWNADFVSGATWPHVALENRDCMRFDGSDVKAPYELSRLQFLPVLAKAHRITAGKRYRQTAKDLLSNWIQENPFGVGVNWSMAMEAALRGMSICFLLSLLYPFSPAEQSWLAGATHSLAQHLFFVEANIEFSHLLTSNHYLSDIVGLYCLSTFLEGPGMMARRGKYRKQIQAEIMRQVYEDGGDYEASTGYHVLVTQLFTTALLLMRADFIAPVEASFIERLGLMYRFLQTIASPSGQLPHVGDCDDGRTDLLGDDLHQMISCSLEERNFLRVSQLLGLGQRLFGKKHISGPLPGDDAAWYGLGGDTGATYFPHRTTPAASGLSTRVLPKSGIGVLQQRSAQLLFFAIPNGIHGRGSHTHNDKLSFVLRLRGREVFVDSGTGCYTRDIATRNRFRSTAAHNTLLIDGAEQNRIIPGRLGLFVLGNEAAVSPIQEGSDNGSLFLRASHTGYLSLGVTHSRTIRATGDEQSFVIEDQLGGGGVHDFELNLQLAPGRTAQIVPSEDGARSRILGDSPVHLAVTGPTRIHGAVEPSLISNAYGVMVPAFRLRFWGKTALPARIVTRLSWADSTPTGEYARDTGVHGPVEEGVCQA